MSTSSEPTVAAHAAADRPPPKSFEEFHDERYAQGLKELETVYTHAILKDGTVLAANQEGTGADRRLWEMLDSNRLSKQLNNDLWKTGRGGAWTHIGFAQEEGARLRELLWRMENLRVLLLLTASDVQKLDGAMKAELKIAGNSIAIPALNRIVPIAT